MLPDTVQPDSNLHLPGDLHRDVVIVGVRSIEADRADVLLVLPEPFGSVVYVVVPPIPQGFV